MPAIDCRALAREPYPAFGRWLDDIEHALGERTLLLCLDEFEELENMINKQRLDERILTTLRNIVQHRRRIAVLLSGSHKIDELPIYWASQLVTTTTLHISFLDEDDVRNLIEYPTADFPPNIYAPAAVNRIVHWTHCQPYLVQLVCSLLVERMNRYHRIPPSSFVTDEDVEAVIPVALDRGVNYFYDLWAKQAETDIAKRILEAMAQANGERLSHSELRRIYYDEEMLHYGTSLLISREIIEAHGDGYRVLVPLVAEYVRHLRPRFEERVA